MYTWIAGVLFVRFFRSSCTSFFWTATISSCVKFATARWRCECLSIHVVNCIILLYNFRVHDLACIMTTQQATRERKNMLTTQRYSSPQSDDTCAFCMSLNSFFFCSLDLISCTMHTHIRECANGCASKDKIYACNE